ncbi:MAG TPA: AAA family ATPase, partial [Longimicrobium sp.]|nr:AAA family ATPase [Longimicrobium sp.]
MIQADFFRLGGTPPRMAQLLDGMHQSDPDRWLPRRLILQNYWLFREPEVFHFARGNLMLTGQNESGKSTVLVTAITLVLDMVLTPDRVDTMGSNDRSIRYYLVGKDDAPENSPYYFRERTAYIALEFERGRSGKFVTVGIGLRSSRDWTNQKVERWGFVMHGRRVEIDFHLHDRKESPRPLRPGELRDRLGSAGTVTDDQRAYKSAVNDALFGFQTVDDYERMLEMLHVVRTPKLGEGLNPRKVEGYLKESLPPIQTAAIEGASEVFSKLDEIEAALDRLGEQIEAARELEGPQEAVVLASARQAAAAYRKSAGEHRSRKTAYDRLIQDLENARDEIARQQERLAELAGERAEYQGRLTTRQEQYREHEAFDLEARLQERRAEHADALAAYDALRTDRRHAQAAWEREQENVHKAEQGWRTARARLAEKLDALRGEARRAYWGSLEQRAALARDALEGLPVDGGGAIAADLARSSIEGEAESRRAALAAILAALDALAAANARQDAARKASDVARREYNQADERFRGAAREAETARAAAVGALETWRGECTELSVPDDAFAATLAAVESYDPQGRRPASILAPLQPWYEQAQESLRARGQELGFRRQRLQGDVAEVEARLRRLAAERDVEPERTEAQQAARRLLREHGIAHVPLFAACDLAGPLAAEPALAARVEAALLDAGLLDALVVPAAEAPRVRTLLESHGLGDRWISPIASSAEQQPVDGGAPWLVPVASAELSERDVAAALRAIGMGDGAGGVIGRDGSWRLGPLHGLAAEPGEARVRYLGETARREERRRRIEEARVRLAELREQLEMVGEEIAGVQARERLLAREWRIAQELPQLQSVHDRINAARREETERERRRRDADLAAEAVESATREVQHRAAALDRATDPAPYLKGRSKTDVDTVAAALKEVLSLVRAIGDEVERMDELRRTHAERTRDAERHRLQAEELAPRIAQADVRVQTLDAAIRTLDEQLARESIGREELRAEIKVLETRLGEIAAAEKSANEIISEARGSAKIFEQQEPDYRDQLRSALIRLQGDEVELRARIAAYPTLDEYAAAARDTGPDRAMQLLLHDADPATLDEHAKEARGQLQSAFLRASGTFEEMSPSLEGEILRFRHEAGPMRLDELHRALEDERGRKETLLEAEDRRLIEQLMLREVVDAIRQAIAQTRRWVDEVNRILGGMKLFKDGIMRLHWDVRAPEKTDAFDPRRLDDLLTQRGVALTDARREELLDIFRTMVA